jgi:simple sugar transport system substrate-binding protein
MKRRNLFGYAAALPALVPGLTSLAKAEGKKYTFYHILWSMPDANVQFHINAGKKYMESHPNVEIKYIGPEKYDPAEHAKFLDTAINAKPDGITMHISSVDALMPGLKACKEAGIPFVSVTGHPPSAEDNAKLEGLILTWVGADESKTGGVMAKRVLQEGVPKRVAYLFSHLGHAGQQARAKGFFESMPSGVASDSVVIGEEPQAAADAIRAYLTKNPDVTVLFGSALANKWVTDIIADTGRKDLFYITSDDSPTSLECVLQGFGLATFTQQFPIQAPFAYEILLQYKENGMAPTSPIVTGPAIIDKSNAEIFKKVVTAVFGEDGYKKLSPY